MTTRKEDLSTTERKKERGGYVCGIGEG